MLSTHISPDFIEGPPAVSLGITETTILKSFWRLIRL